MLYTNENSKDYKKLLFKLNLRTYQGIVWDKIVLFSTILLLLNGIQLRRAE